MPEIGNNAPDFTLPAVLPDGADATLTLKDLRPHWVVLFFYPRDATPTCTREAQDFSRLAPEFAASGARVVGISRDPVGAHRRFVVKQGLNLTLASDDDGEVCAAYGVWGQKKLYGRAYEGILRSTFLIDPAGRIAALWRGVKVAGHADAVLGSLVAAQNRP